MVHRYRGDAVYSLGVLFLVIGFVFAGCLSSAEDGSPSLENETRNISVEQYKPDSPPPAEQIPQENGVEIINRNNVVLTVYQEENGSHRGNNFSVKYLSGSPFHKIIIIFDNETYDLEVDEVSKRILLNKELYVFGDVPGKEIPREGEHFCHYGEYCWVTWLKENVTHYDGRNYAVDIIVTPVTTRLVTWTTFRNETRSSNVSFYDTWNVSEIWVEFETLGDGPEWGWQE